MFRQSSTKAVDSNGFIFPTTIKPPEEYLYDDSFDGSDDEDIYRKPKRQQWSNKFQFVLACVGYSVGLGSCWRFPYLSYKSEGGAFLIPYFIILIICGVPMLFMELAIGQFTGRGPIGAIGQLCPLLKGAGVASVVISFLLSTYYSVIIAYGIYYFFNSFKSIQPWVCSSENLCNSNMSNIAVQFYENKVLNKTDGIEHIGNMRWDLTACLLFAWLLIYFSIWKSIKSSGKVRYFTGTFPLFMIIILMGNALMLPGAHEGMKYFFRPDWSKLGDPKLWINALSQTFNSMGVAFGSMICFASYNKYNNNILYDTIAVTLVNGFASIMVGIFTFCTIGNLAHEQNVPLDANFKDVLTDGPGLIFVVFPQAIAQMKYPHVWGVLFFFMLLCLALNSQFAIVEVVVTSLQDGFPVWIKRNLMCHEVLVFIVCLVSFLCGLPNVTDGGIYFFQLIDHYAASISIMYVAFTEVIAVAWFYGAWRLSQNIEHMTGRLPSLFFKFCWVVAAPFLIFSVWVFYIIAYTTPTYGNYHYPAWAIAIGWIITSISILCIPIFAIYALCKAEGDTFHEKLRNAIKPTLYLCKDCGEHYCEHQHPKFDEAETPMLEFSKYHNGTVVASATSNYTSVNNTPMTDRKLNKTNVDESSIHTKEDS